MDFFGLGTNELLVILLLAAILLGPERLARAARTAGKFIRELKSYFASLSTELKAELDILDEIKKVEEDIKTDL